MPVDAKKEKAENADVVTNVNWEAVEKAIEESPMFDSAESLSLAIKMPKEFLPYKIRENGGVEEADFNLLLLLLGLSREDAIVPVVEEPEQLSYMSAPNPMEEMISKELDMILTEVKGIRQVLEEYITKSPAKELDKTVFTPEVRAKLVLEGLLQANGGRVKETTFASALSDAEIAPSCEKKAIEACQCKITAYGTGRKQVRWIEPRR